MNVSKVVKSICYNALIAALYVALVFIFSFMSYEAVQVRLAEVLIFLVIINKRLTPGVVIGCFIANLIGPFGLIDAVVGSIATLACCVLLSIFKKPWTGLLILPLCNILVGLEISFIENLSLIPTLITILWVMVGELISAIVGMLTIYSLKKNSTITEFLNQI